jgi:hypothetical protein
MAFMWLLMLAPKSMKGLLPVFDRIGPFFCLVPLATICAASDCSETRVQVVVGCDGGGDNHSLCFSSRWIENLK